MNILFPFLKLFSFFNKNKLNQELNDFKTKSESEKQKLKREVRKKQSKNNEKSIPHSF